MEKDTRDLVNMGIAVELIVSSPRDPEEAYGVRLRTYGKQLPTNRMILARGITFEEALSEAISKAKAGRWEHLDWAKRPWPIGLRADAGAAAAMGLV